MTAGGLVSEGAAASTASESVRRSGTSFAAGMNILKKPRREAMHAIYAFCRDVDDIADGPADVVDKRLSLAAWRAEIDRVYAGAPTTALGAALVGPARAYDLPREEFLLMIEGMEMDAEGPIVAPPMERLRTYTRRVAGAVGLLSMPVFGAPRTEAARTFALSLGDALQLTNILRDVRDDAGVGRLYLPRELLDKHGVPPDPEAALEAPGTIAAMRDLGALAKAEFARVRETIRALDWRTLRPALLMMGVYETYLGRIEGAGWDTISKPVRAPGFEKALIAARWYFAPKLKAR
jgi:phytoene synthase